MDITRQDINKITFKDVVDFCEQKVIENLFLDYKKDKPGDLSKQIAAFSNASGGLIVIGVEEDANSYPAKWEGVVNINKPVDQIHQMANNVVPLPTYELAATNEVGGRIFILLRIIEGDSAPYVTRTDPTVWIRTGNISTPVGIANREDLIQLVNKSENSESRRMFMKNSLIRQYSDLEEHKIAADRRRIAGTETPLPAVKHTDDRSMLDIVIMPFNPTRRIVDVKELSDLNTLFAKFVPNGGDLTSFTSSVQPVTNGLANLRHTRTGEVEFIQVDDTGSLAYFTDLRTKNDQGNPSVYVYHIMKHLMDILLSASLLYRSYGYNGSIIVSTKLSNVKGLNVYRMTAGGMDQASNDLYASKHTYNWEYRFTTAELNNKEVFIDEVADLIETMHWDLGDPGIGKDNLKTILKEKFNWNIFGLESEA